MLNDIPKKDKLTLLKMVSETNIISQLETIIHSVLRERPLPIVYENKIRLGNLLIRKTGEQWTIYNTEKNNIIAKTHYRKTALILAKVYLKDSKKINEIKMIDSDIFKHSTDIEYYKHFIQNLHDKNKVAVRAARLCDSENKLDIAERKLAKYLDFA